MKTNTQTQKPKQNHESCFQEGIAGKMKQNIRKSSQERKNLVGHYFQCKRVTGLILQFYKDPTLIKIKKTLVLLLSLLCETLLIS